MTQAEKEAAKAAKLAEKEAAKANTSEVDENGFIVADPQILRPVELPLVIKLPEGESWKNPEQEEYARYLNGYAYKNPKKWAKKKGDITVQGVKVLGLLSKLALIGEDPSKIFLYKGMSEVEQQGKLSYDNKLINQ